MQSMPRKLARHILIFVLVFLVLTAVAIWLGLGPVVHSWQA
jgi:Flp pilus assembly protein TadB